MLKMGGMEGMMGMMPGMGKMARQVEEAGLDDKIIRHQIALIHIVYVLTVHVDGVNP